MAHSLKPELTLASSTSKYQVMNKKPSPAKPQMGVAIFAFFIGMTAMTTLSPDKLWAGTIPAATCLQSDVAAAVSGAGEGDTVVLPPCPDGVSWTTSLSITKGIIFKGAGIGRTVLIDNVPKGSPNCGGTGPLINIDVQGNIPWRITGLTIRGGVTDPYICSIGHITLRGSSHSFRVDHIALPNMQSVGIRVYDDLWGVIDHNVFTGDHKQALIIFHDKWGGVGGYGDNSWAQPSSLGTERAIFIEDNVFNDDHAQGAGAFDAFAGARLVFRYNKLSFIGSHGTESGGRFRGIRQFEIYGNTFTSQTNGSGSAFYLRGGTGVVFNNTYLCKNNDCIYNPYNALIAVENDRDRDKFSPWGTCDGTSPFDKNDGIIASSGTHNGPNGANNVLTDTNKSWSPDQWSTDYAVLNITRGWSSVISSNTSTTATTQASIYGASRAWNAGDTYHIRRAYPCIDQIGRGAGTLLSGDTPTPAAWPNQPLEPVYQWNNNFIGNVTPTISTQSTHARPNRDFYDNTQKPGYMPYTYPHPLVNSSTPISDTSSAPPAPQNLAVQQQ